MPPPPPFFNRKSIFIMKSMVCAGNEGSACPSAACCVCVPTEMKEHADRYRGHADDIFPCSRPFPGPLRTRAKIVTNSHHVHMISMLLYAYHVHWCLELHAPPSSVYGGTALVCFCVREYGCSCAPLPSRRSALPPVRGQACPSDSRMLTRRESFVARDRSLGPSLLNIS